MIYAVISDIHSNLEALHAILKKVDEIRPHKVICLGDIVGYGANPNECVDIIRGKNIISLRGNHDNAASGLSEPYNFNAAARRAALWTRTKLTDENRKYLAGLPDERGFENFMAVHGAPSDPDRYILSESGAEEEFGMLGGRPVCFFGHTHRAVTYRMCKNYVDTVKEKVFPVESGCSYLINPGSVGQPRDGDPQASFLSYDDSGRIEFYRVGYDIELAQRKILEAGLDEILAARLSLGR